MHSNSEARTDERGGGVLVFRGEFYARVVFRGEVGVCSACVLFSSGGGDYSLVYFFRWRFNPGPVFPGGILCGGGTLCNNTGNQLSVSMLKLYFAT